MTPTANRADSQKYVDPKGDELVDSPLELEGRSIRFVLRKTVHEFMTDEAADLAAGLTYYAGP
jgi:membrane protein